MRLKNDAFIVLKQAIAAVQPNVLLKSILCFQNGQLSVEQQSFTLLPNGNMYVIAVGKASAAMAQAVEGILLEHVSGGLVVTKYGHALPLKKLQLIEAGHPIPDTNSLLAGKALLDFSKKLKENDIVLFLLSGGASALLADTPNDLTLSALQSTFQLLLNVGATIQEMNTIRKHLSAIKGGQLARLLMPAEIITLAISDVMGDDPSVIGSGPTVPDNSTFYNAWTIIQQYGLQHQIPLSVQQYLQKGMVGEILETPKKNDICFDKTWFYLLGNNGLALQSAKKTAQALGYETHIVSQQICGEARLMGESIVAQALAYTGKKPACLLFGGETTVTIRGNGLGGRNQELVLAAALSLPPESNLFILSVGTDGTDGPTDAAGAFTDGQQLQLAQQLGLNVKSYLDNNDAYHFFEKVNGLIKTGPTQTNVMDIVVVLIP